MDHIYKVTEVLRKHTFQSITRGVVLCGDDGEQHQYIIGADAIDHAHHQAKMLDDADLLVTPVPCPFCGTVNSEDSPFCSYPCG